jgi:hypothetical protein
VNDRKPSPSRHFTRACFTRRLMALLSALLLRPVSAFAFDKKQENERPLNGTERAVVDAILFYGQSNAGGGGHARAILTSPVVPDRILTFRTVQQIYGTKLVDPDHLDGIGTLRDDLKSPPYPATAMAYALAHSTEPTSSKLYFMHTVWYGGQPLMAFLRGTTAWTDLMTVARRIREVLGKKTLGARIAALVLIQGESGPPGRDNYAGLLRDFLDDVLPSLTAQTGQARAPLCVLLQTNASNTQSATAVDVSLAQWDVARTRPLDTVLAGPMYQFPLSDTVHQSAEGRMMLGDLLALVFETRIIRGQPFEPLHPAAARLVDDAVVISFKRPTDSLGLQWDETWIPPVLDYGFQIKGEAGPISIAAVEITGQSEVTIRLGPRSSKRGLIVSYAMGQPHTQGWAPGRGQLTAPTERRSAFASLGARIPDTVAHYAVRFALPVR